MQTIVSHLSPDAYDYQIMPAFAEAVGAPAMSGAEMLALDPSERAAVYVSVSTLFDGAAVMLFEVSRSRSRARLGMTGMGSGNQRAIT